jgi:hypothetical protein
VVVAVVRVKKVLVILHQHLHHKEILVVLVEMELLHIPQEGEEVELVDLVNHMLLLELVETEFKFLRHLEIHQLLQVIFHHQFQLHKEVVG